MNLTKEYPRSSYDYEKAGGYAMLGRTIDKARAKLENAWESTCTIVHSISSYLNSFPLFDQASFPTKSLPSNGTSGCCKKLKLRIGG